MVDGNISIIRFDILLAKSWWEHFIGLHNTLHFANLQTLQSGVENVFRYDLYLKSSNTVESVLTNAN